MTFIVSSPVFGHEGQIPVRYTCEGEDVSPPWSGAPPSTRSYALIVDDPDAPDPAAATRTWVHWVLYNLPREVDGLKAAVTAHTLPAGALEGTNDWARRGYGGPCPPIGRHRYFHHVYALDVVLEDLHGPTKTRLLQAMQGHVVAQAQLVGTYQKGR